jgi:hypothetical protein
MPAALCLTRDERIAAWVIHAEYMPDEMLTGEFGAGIKAQGWRADRLICDPAGSAANAQTGRSDLDVLEETTGLYPERTTDPAKRDIRAGIIRLRRALAAGQIRVTAELWAAGMSAPKRQRTLARCILGYAYPAKGGDEPLKDGRFDHAIDALRYFAIRELWYDHPLDGRGYKAQV